MASDSKDSHGDIQLVDIKVSQDCGDQPVQVTALSEWTTTRKELWCFYLYFVGNNGIPGFLFGPSQFQNILYQAGYDPSQPPFVARCSRGTDCVLPYLGRVRNINSIAVLLLAIGAWADYGTWRPNILIFFTLLGVSVSFAWLGVVDPSHWRASVLLYILGSKFYAFCFFSLTFWGAAFPGLVRNLPEVQASADDVKKGYKLLDDHFRFESLARNRVSNISLAVCCAGEFVILSIMVGITKALKSDASVENNTMVLSVVIAFSGGMWLLCAIPWFIFEKRRPGLSLPPGASLVTIGFKQSFAVLRECLRLKQTFFYFVFYFLMHITLLFMVGITGQGMGVYLFWLVQKKFNISTKRMLLFNAFWLLVFCVWGLIGAYTNKIGFKHARESWLCQAFSGLVIGPWYAFSVTMMSEVSPLAQMSVPLVFSDLIGKTSAVIGPFVSGAIISATGNNNMPFAFLLGLGAFSTVFLWMVNMEKSRIECEEFVAAEGTHAVFS
ncbi:vacuole effluxer Atg22 like-domain-containing protein [Russula compacta]|nr:vacuole effluxer Atg22 like-domain-containing protein [Russula compacta]